MEQTAVITGTTHGIGRVVATELARSGWRVLMLVRNPALGERVRQEIVQGQPQAALDVVPCDLASLASVQAAAEHVLRLAPDVRLLINNAGMVSMRRQFSADGFERVFATNHLGPFLLTERLRPAMLAGSHIVNVASCAHEQGTLDLGTVEGEGASAYRPQAAYAQSKLANVLHTLALARREAAAGRGVRVNCLHPGVVHTNLLPLWVRVLKPLVRRGMFDAERGARSTLFLARDERAAALHGSYVDEHQQVVPPSSAARSLALQEALWAASEAWVEPYLRG